MPKPLILAFGDSLVEGYGLALTDAFPAQLEAILRQTHPDVTVINEGRSGDTTIGALERMPRVLSKLTARPDLAIVEFGANDLIRGIPLDRTAANLDLILSDFARCGIPMLLARMQAPPMLGRFAQRCDAMYADLATRHGIAAHPFFPPGVLANPALCLRDRIHPNARGIARIVEAFAPAVQAALADVDGSLAA